MVRRLKTPLREFLRTETGGAAIIVAAAVAALVWVNVHASSHEELWETELSPAPPRSSSTGAATTVRTTSPPSRPPCARPARGPRSEPPRPTEPIIRTARWRLIPSGGDAVLRALRDPHRRSAECQPARRVSGLQRGDVRSGNGARGRAARSGSAARSARPDRSPRAQSARGAPAPAARITRIERRRLTPPSTSLRLYERALGYHDGRHGAAGQ